MEIGDEVPEWTLKPSEDSDTHRAIRAQASAETIVEAQLAAFDDLKSALIEMMKLGRVEYWSDEGSKEFEILFSEILHTITSAESGDSGVELGAEEAWKSESSQIHYAVEIKWEREAFKEQAARLFELTGRTNPRIQNYVMRAQAAEDETYEAALLWAAVAGISKASENEDGYRIALEEAKRSLSSLEIELIEVPDKVFVGLRPTLPVIFSAKSNGRPVGNAEFVITFPNRARDGSIYSEKVRLLSDEEGLIRFRPLEITIAGSQELTIAPSAAPFLEFLGEERDSSIDKFETDLERTRAVAEYHAQVRIRSIPMGILIVETDLIGNVLDGTDAAEGLFDNLIADEFNVSIMELDPSEILLLSERVLLRDLKTDARFGDKYERIIHGKVSLESFEQVGDTYTVRVSGILVMSDVQKQVTLLRSEITKTSRGTASQQAISTAFKQAGRSFAEEIIELTP